MSVSPDEYQQLSQVEHVLLRTDMYLGPTDRVPRLANCFDLTTQNIQVKQVLHSKAQEQTFKEILGNAGDNVLRSRQINIDPIQIEIQVEKEWIRIRNYGRHIPVDLSRQTRIWIPEMIFGNMLSGSNFRDGDNENGRFFIGKNGIGAKATNIFSRIFSVKCGDPEKKLFYEQVWEKNMSIKHSPNIIPYEGPGFTEISYLLDFPRFGVNSIDQEALEIYGAHAVTLSYACQIPVIYNGIKFQIQKLSDLAGLFFPVNKNTVISYQDPNGSYDLCLIDTPDAGMSLSFVNGMITENGGVHVDAAYRVVIGCITKFLEKAVEGIKLTKRDIVNHVSVFIACRLANPKFNAQVKDCLVRPEPKIEIPDKIIEGIRRWRLIEIMHKEIERKQTNKLNKKLKGEKKRGNWGKAEPANAAGTRESHLCTYILTEGDSADSYRIRFISNVPNGMGREYYGSQPLRGKLPNTLQASYLDILENQELMAICHNLNLKPDLDYRDPANFQKLHYGRVLVFPDPDNDGKHVLGLILLFFMVKFPSLVSRGYLNFLRIPTVRVKINGKEHSFYSLESFKKALAALPKDIPVGKPHYFKGLGASTDEHIRQDFENPRIVTFVMDEKAIERTLLAFDRTESNLRKQWIADWVRREVIEVEEFYQLPISLFIDYELINYSIENIIRAIPEAIDGLKDAQRKALYSAFQKLKKGDKEMIVERIANHAAETTNYKHGAICLAETIIKMTQSFVGANNMPYFSPKGQFGTRNKGGKDAPNPRYPKVGLPVWIDSIFRPEDKRLEQLVEDEGEKQECVNFYPILPMHVINGVRGIGSAYSCNIPSHHPLEVAHWILKRIMKDLNPNEDVQLPVLKPWYRGFTGEIKILERGFSTEGRIYQENDHWVIDELPIGVWTSEYEEFLNKLLDQGDLTDVKSYSTAERPKFLIFGYKSGTPTLKKMGLITRHSYNNMTVLYRTPDRGISPKIYSNLNDLLEDFYKIRLAKYKERKELQLKELESEITEMKEKARFIHLVAVTKELEIRNRSETEILEDLNKYQLNPKWLDRVHLRSLNKDQIPKLEARVQAKVEEYENLFKTPPEVIYYREVEEFIEKYKIWEQSGSI